MRQYLFCLAMAVCGAAMADDLGDVNKLLESKSYPQAVAMLTRLSDAGNASAQLRLGQMYWYGEGVAVDRPRADALFAKAAAAGNKEAQSALGMTGARQQHLGDIAWWTSTYDGADLASGQLDCKAPAVPARSTTNQEIKATNDAINAWKACYNGFVKNLNDVYPVGKRIPGEIADLMTDAEMEQAKRRLTEVYARVGDKAKVSAEATLTAFDNWQKATEDWVRQQNLETAQRLREAELARDNVNRNMPQPPKTVIVK